jgi:predicted nucleic acid-binding protein
MADIIPLDAGPLGMASHPRPVGEIVAWLGRLLGSGKLILVPEIADYEIRRELLRAGKTKGLARLDELKAVLGYLPITTDAMLKAADFWAAARRLGRPTSHEKTLDADAILAGQAATYSDAEADIVVASTNPRHIARFVPAQKWDEIPI